MAADFKKKLKEKSLRWKVSMAFMVMSVIPTLIVLYLLTNHVRINSDNGAEMTAIFIACIWLVAAGYVMIRQTVMAITGLASDAKAIAAGQYDIKALAQTDAELKDIAESVNFMTDRMRDYISELREYGERAAVLDGKIKKKVSTLTNLIKIGEMISSGVGFNEIADFAVKSMRAEIGEGFTAAFFKTKNGQGYYVKSFSKDPAELLSGEELLDQLTRIEDLLKGKEYVLFGRDSFGAEWQDEIRKKSGDVKMIFLPINSHDGSVGIVMSGTSQKSFIFKGEQIEAIKAFVNEVALAHRSMEASDKIRSLEVLDKVTGLYSLRYMTDRLDDEVSRAVFYQRPCSLILVDIDNLSKKSPSSGKDETVRILGEIAVILRDICPPTGKVGMFGHFEFGMILPEVNKRGSLKIGENIRSRVAEKDFIYLGKGIVTVSIGLGENPIDGATGEEILAKSREFIQKAKIQGGNLVIGE